MTQEDKKYISAIDDCIDMISSLGSKYYNKAVRDALQNLKVEYVDRNLPAWEAETFRYLVDTPNISREQARRIAFNAIDLVYIQESTKEEEKQWRPSEGQLECLSYAIDKAEKDYTPLANNRIYLTLKALKEQLEKL